MIVTLKKQLRWLTRHMLAVAAVLAIMVAALAFPLSEEPAAQAEQVAVQPPLVRPAPAQPAAAQPQNPDLDLNKCGATVAFVVDLSNSLKPADLENQKKTLREMVKSLEGAPYVFSLYTFASEAPAHGTGNQNLKSMSLRDPEDVKKLRDRIDSLFLPGNGFGGTNWEQGLRQVADDIEGGTHYDTVYFITDGKPTFDRNGKNYQGNTTEQSEIDNAVKQKERFVESKTQLIPIGVGSAIGDQRPQNIYEPSSYYNYYYGYWRVAQQLTAETILRKIATAPDKTIISPDYEKLVTDLQKTLSLVVC
ncbi:vWA domain-containing protein [Corynebacterium pseudotuberculosis]|uniref:vWA domain-containing protein n=1 Tax=Corynebacterium pseudotuberculosis TaxID=1719 RepID=UPI0034E98003